MNGAGDWNGPWGWFQPGRTPTSGFVNSAGNVCLPQVSVKCILTTFASFADVRFSNNTSDHLEAILKTERQREITKVAARGTTSEQYSQIY